MIKKKSFDLSWLQGSISVFLYALNIIIFPTILLLTAVVRMLLIHPTLRRPVTDFMENYLTAGWIKTNSWVMNKVSGIQWDIQGDRTHLRPDSWYFIVCNHQTWLDILVLQHIFIGKVPLPKFFLKQQLIWGLPFAGLVCWVLDFPFMKRHSKDYLKKHPDRRDDDLNNTKRLCALYKQRPTTLVAFVESTRFTPQKHAQQNKQYPHLLRPRAGAMGLTFQELGGTLRYLVDVTVVYDQANPNFWDFMCGRMKTISIRYQVIPIDASWQGDYEHDNAFRRAFQKKLNALWEAKSIQIDTLKKNLTHDH